MILAGARQRPLDARELIAHRHGPIALALLLVVQEQLIHGTGVLRIQLQRVDELLQRLGFLLQLAIESTELIVDGRLLRGARPRDLARVPSMGE